MCLRALLQMKRCCTPWESCRRTKLCYTTSAYGVLELYDGLLMVMKDVWEEGTVVEDWMNAKIVPIPKTGNLCQGDKCSEVLAELNVAVPLWRLSTTGQATLESKTSNFINTASGWASCS